MMLRAHWLTALAGLALLIPTASAQDLEKEETSLVKKAVTSLNSFATAAKSAKVGQRAKQAYDLILEYDPDHTRARSALGFRKVQGNWEEAPPDKRQRWRDQANYEDRYKIAGKWFDTTQKLAELHLTVAKKATAAGNEERAKYHYQKAVYYNPLQEEAHTALGNNKGDGFFGSQREIEFAQRMRALETKAIEIARTDPKVEALPQEQMPEELVRLGKAIPEWMRKPSFEIHGSRSEHFTVWTRGTQENADNCVKWAERALQFGVHILGEKRAKQINFVERASKTFAWYGFVWTTREREEFLKANPNVWQGEGSIERAQDFANNVWNSSQGRACVLNKLTPAQMHDTMIAYTFFYGMCAGRNEGLGQGIIHAATWYMQGTSISKWGARPEGTVSDPELELPESTNWWLRAIRDQATSNQDAPLDLVPRERLSRFRNDVRLKGWSYTTWVWAAYPDQWLDFFLSMENEPVPLPDDVYKNMEKAFGKPIQELEAEWREWARGDSGVAAGTGYGPPMLPEQPSDAEIAVLERLNKVRALNLAFSWPAGADMRDGTFHGLPPCDLDAEATIACEEHARYLTRWPEEHLRWPEAHEQNPALEGFTPRGMRAAMSSVIVSTNRDAGQSFAESSIDGWLGTPYHRFPLLEHNINRFGYSYIYENDYSIAVLDMGSLQEPYDPGAAPRFVVWPPHNMKDVPTSFHGTEQPNPLYDQPADQQDITKTGYPLSLQLQTELARTLVDAEIVLYEVKSGGKQPEKNFCHEQQGSDFKTWSDRCGGKNAKEIPIWVHTPRVPLNKRMEVRDVVFAIPKAPLDPNEDYQVRVKLQIGGADPLWFIWEFKTGRQREGLRLR